MGQEHRVPENPYFEFRLRTAKGRNALDQLCDKGCDRVALREKLIWFAQYKTLTIRSHFWNANEVDQEVPVKVNLRSLDTRGTAHPGFTLKQLGKVAKRATRLQEDVAELRRTPLVSFLVECGKIPRGDLLFGSHVLDGGGRFEGLLNLPELARQCGPQARPDYTRMRKDIHFYIRRCTRHWNDRLFAEIHNDLFPKSAESDKTVQRWRKVHGLTDHPH